MNHYLFFLLSRMHARLNIPYRGPSPRGSGWRCARTTAAPRCHSMECTTVGAATTTAFLPGRVLSNRAPYMQSAALDWNPLGVFGESWDMTGEAGASRVTNETAHGEFLRRCGRASWTRQRRRTVEGRVEHAPTWRSSPFHQNIAPYTGGTIPSAPCKASILVRVTQSFTFTDCTPCRTEIAADTVRAPAVRLVVA